MDNKEIKQEYFCEKCKLESFVMYRERMSVFQVINMMEDDHRKKSPECNTDVMGLRVKKYSRDCQGELLMDIDSMQAAINPDTYMGIHFIPNKNLTVQETVPRTWKERLFSWPWRPMRKNNVINVPDPTVYLIGRHKASAHPATIALIKGLPL